MSRVVSGMGGGFSHTSRSPWRWTSARALPGLLSRCRMRLACAYSTGSPVTASNDGMRITLRSRSSDFARRRGLAGFHPRGLLVGLADLGLHRIRIDGRIQRSRCIDVGGIDFDEVMRFAHERGAAQVGDVGNLRAARQAMRNLDDLPF